MISSINPFFSACRMSTGTVHQWGFSAEATTVAVIPSCRPPR
jgi:hypothetical protein